MYSWLSMLNYKLLVIHQKKKGECLDQNPYCCENLKLHVTLLAFGGSLESESWKMMEG